MSDSTPKVTVYRTTRCPFCVAAEQLLRGKGVTFEQIYLDGHPDRYGFVAGLKPGHYTVPLIVIDDDAIGGYDELTQLDRSGRLDELLASS